MRYVLIAMLLAGCQTMHTPQDVLQIGTKSTHTVFGSPDTAASCIARNAMNYRPYAYPFGVGLTSTVLPLDDGAEVVIQLATQTPLTTAVIQLRDRSAAVRYLQPPGGTYAERDTIPALLKGC